MDKDLADQYQLNILGNLQNIGILNAFIELVEKCQTKYFIFCENDFILMSENFEIKKTLEDVSNILDFEEYAQVKLSNSKNPGFLYIKGDKEWLEKNQDDYKYKVESLSWVPNPLEFYSNLQTVNLNYQWYEFKSQDQMWSNHIHVCNTKYLKEIVIPLLKYNRDHNPKLDVKYQGLEDTLNFTQDIPNPPENIKKLIEEHHKRTIYSGGGNFYHHKV